MILSYAISIKGPDLSSKSTINAGCRGHKTTHKEITRESGYGWCPYLSDDEKVYTQLYRLLYYSRAGLERGSEDGGGEGQRAKEEAAY